MRNLLNCLAALLMGCCLPLFIWAGVVAAYAEKRQQARLFRDVLRFINSAPPRYSD